MLYLNPNMLWGLLALAIPVAIHFWYQKKGKTLDWAAFQWLTEQTTLTHRGIRLDEIPLMVLRCFLLLLFVLLLAKPVLNWFNPKTAGEKIHLVEPNTFLANNFRFELENALKNGEKVYWLGKEPDDLNDLGSIPNLGQPELYLQQNISKLGKDNRQLNLYITNSQKWGDLPKILIPESFRLFSMVDSSSASAVPYLDLGSGKKLFVGKKGKEIGQLLVAGATEKPVRFAANPVHEGKIKVLVDYKNDAERQAIQASLLALNEVYDIPFETDIKKKGNGVYDWIFTDQKIKNPGLQTLYMVSDKDFNTNKNVVQIPDSLQLHSSELLQTGRLPEWLGEVLIDHYQLNENTTALSQRQLASLFEKTKPGFYESANRLYSWLLLCFIIALGFERWISLKKPALQKYA